MVTLESTVKKLTMQKQEISKIRRLSEREFQRAKAVSRKYTSSLTSLQKRVKTSREKIEVISQEINQKMSQLESIKRLKKIAQERLDLEIRNKEQLESEIDFSNTDDEKEIIVSRIQIITRVIDDIKNEIKQRNPMEKKLTQIINEINKSKLKISGTVSNSLNSKPELINLVKTSTIKLEQTAKKYQAINAREDIIKTKLSKIMPEFSKLLKKRLVTKAKAIAKARADARAKAKKAKARADARAKAKKAKARKAKAKPKARKAKAKPKARKAKAKPKARKAKAKPKARKAKAKPKARKKTRR